MIKLKRTLAVLLGSAMCFSAAAMAACDGESDVDPDTTIDADTQTDINTPSENTNIVTVDELYSAAAETFENIYASSTGYEIASEISVDYTEGGATVTTPLSSVVIDCVYDDGFNADMSGVYYNLDAYDYISVMARGGDVYFGYALCEGSTPTEAEKSAILYEKTQFDLSNAENISSALAQYIPAETFDISEISDLLVSFGGTVEAAGDGYTLTVDVVDAVNSVLDKVDAVLAYIAMQNLDNLTVGDMFINFATKMLVESYFNDITGEDIYNVISYACELAAKANVDSLTDILAELPEGTADQTAYEYIVAVIESLELESYPMSGLSEYITAAQTAIDEAQAAICDMELGYVLTFNSSMVLVGASMTSSGIPVWETDATFGITANISITEKAVTLAEVPEEYVTGYMLWSAADTAAPDETNYGRICLTNGGNAYLYTYNGEYREVNAGLLGTYTADASDNITLLIGGESYTTDGGEVQFTVGTTVYSVYYTVIC